MVDVSPPLLHMRISLKYVRESWPGSENKGCIWVNIFITCCDWRVGITGGFVVVYLIIVEGVPVGRVV